MKGIALIATSLLCASLAIAAPVKTSKGKKKVNRISYVKMNPEDGSATGTLVLENLCSAHFSSIKA